MQLVCLGMWTLTEWMVGPPSQFGSSMVLETGGPWEFEKDDILSDTPNLRISEFRTLSLEPRLTSRPAEPRARLSCPVISTKILSMFLINYICRQCTMLVKADFGITLNQTWNLGCAVVYLCCLGKVILPLSLNYFSSKNINTNFPLGYWG